MTNRPPSLPAPPAIVGRILGIWSRAAVVLVSALVLFAIANFLVFLVQKAVDRVAERLDRSQQSETDGQYGLVKLRTLYPEKSDAEIQDIIKVKHGIGLLYEPFNETKSESGISNAAAVHEAGFRLIGEGQGPWPLDKSALNIFVFGGEQVYGPQLQDDATLPAQLQRQIREAYPGRRVFVYNFGTYGHYSIVERHYFEQLAIRGFIPDIAIFIDGANEFVAWSGEPPLTDWFRRNYIIAQTTNFNHNFSWYVANAVKSLPLVRPFLRHEVAPPAPDENDLKDPAKIQKVIANYVSNRRIAVAQAAAFNTVPVFVIAGVPDNVRGPKRRAVYGMPTFRDAIAHQAPKGAEPIYCDRDLKIYQDQPAYLDSDQGHYSPAGAVFAAHCIFEGLKATKRLESPKSTKDPTAR